MRVLVVEDEPQMAEQLRKGLEREGYSVLVAADGQQGLDLARNIDKIALVVVLISVLPILWTVHKERREAAAAAANPAP